MRFTFSAIENVRGPLLIRSDVNKDDRGWFMEAHRQSAFAEAGIAGPFVQDDSSFTNRAGTLRGLHYQAGSSAQGKIVRCIAGRVFDVGVDIRRTSPTYGRFVAVELDGKEPTALWLPPGFAHGFLTLTNDVTLLYKHTHEYDAEASRAIRWNDPALAIGWPLEQREPVLSARDAAAPLLANADIDQ